MWVVGARGVSHEGEYESKSRMQQPSHIGLFTASAYGPSRHCYQHHNVFEHELWDTSVNMI